MVEPGKMVSLMIPMSVYEEVRSISRWRQDNGMKESSISAVVKLAVLKFVHDNKNRQSQPQPVTQPVSRPIIGVMPTDPAERARIMDAAYEKMQAKLEAKQQAEWDKRENAVNHSPEVTDEDLNKWD